jgi:hypothetical protein
MAEAGQNSPNRTWYLWHVDGHQVAVTNEPIPPKDMDGRVMTEMKLLDQCLAASRDEADAIFEQRHPADSQ